MEPDMPGAAGMMDKTTRPVAKLCFSGGPRDGQFIDWFDAPPTWEVSRVRRAEAVLVKDGELPPPTDPYQRGTYELVPTDEDPLWRIARLYRWKGWRGESE